MPKNTAQLYVLHSIFVFFCVYHTKGCEGEVGKGCWRQWDSLGDVTEAAFDWLGLKDNFCYWLTAELGYLSTTSQPLWLSLYFVF
jgi:hypothetical protein